jgi:hypothetical protein
LTLLGSCEQSSLIFISQNNPPMMKPHKMLFELIAQKETEQGAIDLLASVSLMKDI